MYRFYLTRLSDGDLDVDITTVVQKEWMRRCRGKDPGAPFFDSGSKFLGEFRLSLVLSAEELEALDLLFEIDSKSSGNIPLCSVLNQVFKFAYEIGLRHGQDAKRA